MTLILFIDLNLTAPRYRVLTREDPTVVETIFRGMEHPSHFVSRSASRLLVLLVKKGGQGVVKRLEAMGLLKQLHKNLPDDCVEKQVVSSCSPLFIGLTSSVRR